MTLSDLGTRMIKLGEDLPEIIDESFKVGLVNLRANIQNRIFNEGLDINGNRLGNYSANTTLVGAKSFRNKTQADAFFQREKSKRKAARKSGEQQDPDSGWRTVEGKSLFLLKGGYKELRRLQGMQSDHIDLKYTGELQNTGIRTNTENGQYLILFSNDLSRDKARGFESRHGGLGTVFGASEAEADQTIKDINEAFTQKIKTYV